MLPGKTTPPTGAALVLPGDKPSSPSVLSVKQAPAGAARGVVLAVDGKRTMAVVAAVDGRAAFSSDGDDLGPKEFKADMIKKVAAEMSSLLGSLCPPPENSSFSEQYFSKEVQTLQKACDAMVEGGVSDEDGAMTILLGVQARISLLLTTDKSPQDLLLSSIGQIKASVEEHTKPTKLMASDADGRMRVYDMVKESPIVQPTPTVCSADEVKAVLYKTVALLESSEPANSTTGMAGLFYKLRSNCRALAEDVEKNGVDDKTGSAIALIHVSALFVLRQHKKYFNYEDAADDSLLSSLRRLEVALRDYMLGGRAEETTDD